MLRKLFLKLKISALLSIAFISNLAAQSPTHLPREDTKPVDFFESWENITFYIIIPIVILVLYILWKRSLRNKNKQDQQD